MKRISRSILIHKYLKITTEVTNVMHNWHKVQVPWEKKSKITSNLMLINLNSHLQVVDL